MTTRRGLLLGLAGAGGLLALGPQPARASDARLITRAIPGTNERLPIVGLGSSATFAQVARSEDITALRAVLKQMVDLGGTVFDTAPAYGASEEVAGQIGKPVIDLVQVHNMGGAMGRLPDAAMRKRMIQLVEALP
ncbi:MAG TPA: aldo/keto reductase [Burkholderiales bacterium]|nr:aldo/keto reductase [Burkholderiales bacterium]